MLLELRKTEDITDKMMKTLFIFTIHCCLSTVFTFPMKGHMGTSNILSKKTGALSMTKNKWEILNAINHLMDGNIVPQYIDGIDDDYPDMKNTKYEQMIRNSRRQNTEKAKKRIVKRSFDRISNRGNLDPFSGDESVRRYLQRLLELHRQEQAQQRSASEPLAIEIVLPILRQNRNSPGLQEEEFYDELQDMFL